LAFRQIMAEIMAVLGPRLLELLNRCRGPLRADDVVPIQDASSFASAQDLNDMLRDSGGF